MKRPIRLLIPLLLIAAFGWAATSLGHILHHEDPLEKSDVIFVLGGPRLERVAEAGELWLEGWAPQLLLSRQRIEPAETVLLQRGIHVPLPADIQRAVLNEMGVPLDAISIVPNEQLTTATESDELLAISRGHKWRRIIVVTSKLHTARTRLAMGRRFDGSGVQILVRASRYDPANIDQWWRNRGDLQFALFEAQRMVAYWIGLAD